MQNACAERDRAAALAAPEALRGYLDGLRRRTELCRGTHRSNCLGTALFIVGEVDRDEFIHSCMMPHFLGKMKEIDAPFAGCLVSFEKGADDFREVTHLGVAVSANPPLLANRRGCNGTLIESEPIGATTRAYPGTAQFFYVPEGLDRALSAAEPLGVGIPRIVENHLAAEGADEGAIEKALKGIVALLRDI